MSEKETPSSTALTWDSLKSQCNELIKTGFLPKHLRTPEQAAAIVLKGRELGIGMMEAFEGLYVIDGRVGMEGQLMLARAYRTGEVEYLKIDAQDDKCVVTIKRTTDKETYTATFGQQEALLMGLSGKDNYKKQKRTMYKWRALSDAVRTKFPDAVGGAHTPEELGATVKATSSGDLEVVALPTTVSIETTAKPSQSERLVNQTEITYLAAKMDDFKFTVDEVRAYMQEHFKKNSRKELTVSELTEIIDWMNASFEREALDARPGA